MKKLVFIFSILFSVFFLSACTSTSDQQIELLREQNTLLQQQIETQKQVNTVNTANYPSSNNTSYDDTTSYDDNTTTTTTNTNYNAPSNNYNAPSQNSCCKVCSKGKACWDSCISRSYTCHKWPGCACDW